MQRQSKKNHLEYGLTSPFNSLSITSYLAQVNIKLSVVIISFNEEHNIARCIESVRDVADEILIVDSHSTDATREIALAMGARIVEHDFDGHIQQKNRAASLAKYDYVLSLDADEALSDELRISVDRVKQNWKHDAFQMNRCTNWCGKWIKHSGWYPDKKLRLWDRRKGEWGVVNPHDKWELYDGSKNYVWINGDILHYSYYTVEEHWKQAGKFSTIAAKALYIDGKRISWAGVYLKPVSKFIRNYILRAGFLDGRSGFLVCKITAWETYQKYLKLYDMQGG
ncbi:MAG: glycosyltransferase family 2 protein [Chitinophagaceae bacterium]|nr:glycosyltransferase family 2 protein [Chitinophagaceae bacterium]